MGDAAHFAPLLSTALLIMFGFAQAKPTFWLAAVMIVTGAMLAAKEMLMPGRRSAPGKSADALNASGS